MFPDVTASAGVTDSGSEPVLLLLLLLLIMDWVLMLLLLLPPCDTLID